MTALESKALGIALEKLELNGPPQSHERAEVMRRYEAWLDWQIIKLTDKRNELRESLRHAEQQIFCARVGVDSVNKQETIKRKV